MDHFLVHLFGEILSQPGFGFRDDLSMAMITNQIIQSVQKFRLSAGEVQHFNSDQLGSEYYKMVKTGVLANQYLQSWTQAPEDSVYLAPAYTFLLNNRPVDYQFWLDVGSRGWYERIFQPLTNPHVLHRDWQTGNLMEGYRGTKTQPGKSSVFDNRTHTQMQKGNLSLFDRDRRTWLRAERFADPGRK